MTPAPAGGGVKALGASLLDQVLAETLDPAYQQVAEARAERTAGSAGSPAAAPRLRSGRSAALVAGTLLASGLLVTTAYNQAAAEVPGLEEVRAALISDIQRESAASDRLTDQLEELQAEVSRTRDHLLDSSDEGQRVLEELSLAGTGAGAVEVSGPGLLVTLADAEPDAADDPVGGTAAPDPRGDVDDGDLQLAVNALWAAGAEAISINDQRLGPTSAIRFAGEAVLVDYRPVTSPYEIKAIGDPGDLSAGFLGNEDVRALALISATYGLRFDYAQEDELVLPATSPPELQAARPLDDTPPAAEPSAAGAPGSGAPSSRTPDEGEPGAAP